MRMSDRAYFAYILGLLSLGACATTSYRYYGLTLENNCYQQGTLLGKQASNGWPDIPLETCKPDAASNGKCIIQLTDEFFRKDADLKNCVAALDTCQRGQKPSE